MAPYQRQELGEFSSTVCLKSLIKNIVRCGGAAILIRGGKGRGQELAEQLGVMQKAYADDELRQMLASALGPEGTRLCIVEDIETSESMIKVKTRETACSFLEEPGSDLTCLFTMGTFAGFFEVTTGKRIRCKQTESVLRGQDHDTFELSLMD